MGALKVATAVGRVVRAARQRPEWTAAHELTAVLVTRLARQLDRAEGSAEVVRLTREIRALIGTLPGETPAAPPDRGGDDEPDEIDRELAGIVGAAPEVGNSPHS